MDDVRRKLSEAVGSYDPDPETALDLTTQRGRRRRATQRILATTAALLISGALFGASWAVFRSGMEERPARPIPGPSPSASSSPFFSFEEADFHRDTEIRTVDEGTEQGARWELRVQGAALVFPHVQGKDDRAERVICIGFWIEGSFPRARPSCGFPLPSTGENSRVTVSAPSAGRQTDPPVTSFYASTPSETSRMLLDLASGPTIEAQLYGPFPEIGDAKVYLAFMEPRDYPTRFRALDAAGRVIWQKRGYPSPNVMLDASGSGTGTVGAGPATSNPEAFYEVIQCPPKCLYEVGDAMQITFVAHPDEGSAFVGWKGPCVGQGEECTIRVDRDMEVEAIFEKGA